MYCTVSKYAASLGAHREDCVAEVIPPVGRFIKFGHGLFIYCLLLRVDILLGLGAFAFTGIILLRWEYSPAAGARVGAGPAPWTWVYSNRGDSHGNPAC
jgi:hypothetical protein